jgi:hydrogenase/urease accessory protein HupE
MPFAFARKTRIDVAAAVYVLCALTSLACAVLLLRGYAQRRMRLLFWSGLAFVGFSLGNILLVIDTMMVPAVDLSLLCSIPVLAGLIVLIYGLVGDTR